MSGEANGLNGLMSGGLGFIGMIVFLLVVVGLADFLDRNVSSASANAWMLGIVILLLWLWWKDTKRE